MFACEQEGVSPDLLCVAKGITGGYLPLAATLATEEIYEGFLGEHRGLPHLLPRPHLHGQPARLRRPALATLDVFEEERTLGQPPTEDRAARAGCWNPWPSCPW
jgi:adenosylmethionine-8-amino-7-oxononanoate aminotransferase